MAVFNQPLTTFRVVAMVLGLTVSMLCSYCLFWRWLWAIPVPWGLGGGGWSGGGLGGTVYRNHQGRGSGKRTGVFLRWGKIYSPTSSTPLSDLGGSGKQGHPLCQPAAENDHEACPDFLKDVRRISNNIESLSGCIIMARTEHLLQKF